MTSPAAMVLLLSLVVVLISVQAQATCVNDLPRPGQVKQLTELNAKKSVHVLERMKSHFDRSLKNLFTSYGFSSQAVQRPGMAKMLKEESDRNWEEGIDALKKYLQRGGRTYDQTKTDMSATINCQESNFLEQFRFEAKNSLNPTVKAGNSIFYLNQLEALQSETYESAKKLNNLHKMTMHRSETDKIYDADMAHYLEEKLEKEISMNRKFKNLHTNLAKMITFGMGVHLFDASL